MEPLLNVTEFHNLARIAVSTIYHLVAEQKIPHVRIGARVFFDRTVIEEWLKANSVQAVGPSHASKAKKTKGGKSC